MQDVSRRTTWGLVIGGAIAVATAFAYTGLRLDLTHAGAKVPSLFALLLLALAYPRVTSVGQRRVIDVIEAIGLFALLSAEGALMSYAVAAHSSGFTDHGLASIDRSLGFDWLAMYQFVAHHPVISRIARVSYLSIFISPWIVLAALAGTGRASRGRALIVGFGIALSVALISFRFFPARSALAEHVGLGAGYLPVTGIGHIAIIDQLRAGTLPPIDPSGLAGLITFPSIHVAAACLFIWAIWPVRGVRWPMTLLNLAMIAATPVEGTHYFIDVLGGMVTAAFAIGVLHLPRKGTIGDRPRAIAAPVAA